MDVGNLGWLPSQNSNGEVGAHTTPIKRAAFGGRPCTISMTTRLLLGGFRLLEAGLDRRPDARQHVFCRLRVRAGRSQLQVLIEGIGSAIGRDHFVALERSLA